MLEALRPRPHVGRTRLVEQVTPKAIRLSTRLDQPSRGLFPDHDWGHTAPLILRLTRGSKAPSAGAPSHTGGGRPRSPVPHVPFGPLRQSFSDRSGDPLLIDVDPPNVPDLRDGQSDDTCDLLVVQPCETKLRHIRALAVMQMPTRTRTNFRPITWLNAPLFRITRSMSW